MIITKDRVITIDYTMNDKEDQLLDAAFGANSVTYLHGHKNIIPGLEKALEGKTVGDRFCITIPAADAYGQWEEELLVEVSREKLETDEVIEPGMQFEANTFDGVHVLTVTKIAEDTVTLDGNHPLAGKDLTFDITIKNIREADPDELNPGCGCCNGDHDCGDECSCTSAKDQAL